jgi:hypothetical protein
LALEPGGASVSSAALPAGTYDVLGWRPDLGAWWLGSIEHDARRSSVHSLCVRDRGELRVTVDVPPPTTHEDVEVTLLAPTLALERSRPDLGRPALRHVDWSAEHAAFLASVPPGKHTLRVRGAGLAEMHHTVHVAAGATRRVPCKLLPGIECTLYFRSSLPEKPGRIDSDALLPAEILHLESLTPFGAATLEFVGRDLRVADGGFEFTAWIPSATQELTARTRPDPRKRADFKPREGSRRIEPGELDGPGDRVRLEIVLHYAPEPTRQK